MVLGFGEMLDDDKPDKSIWMDDKALVEHFEQVKARRDADKASRGSGDDDWSDFEKGEDVESNALADEFLKEVVGA